MQELISLARLPAGNFSRQTPSPTPSKENMVGSETRHAIRNEPILKLKCEIFSNSREIYNKLRKLLVYSMVKI